MQHIVLFMESYSQVSYMENSKIGNLLMNRFAIEEDRNFEITKILKLDYLLEDYFAPVFSKDCTVDCFAVQGLGHIVILFSE